LQLLREAPTLNAGVSAELEEVEEELATPAVDSITASGTAADMDTGNPEDIEGGKGGLTARGGGSAATVTAEGDVAPPTTASKKGFTQVITSVFSITFLAEWGDRSQIATIALAAAKDPIGVCVGGILGHAVCTAIAVIGGRLLATRISERTVAYVGGVLFLTFAVHSFIVGPPGSDTESFGLMSFLTPSPKEASLTGMTGSHGKLL
jgi:putative Ca2+/H+ antiporter (TMEM165/GDT1 family)